MAQPLHKMSDYSSVEAKRAGRGRRAQHEYRRTADVQVHGFPQRWYWHWYWLSGAFGKRGL